MNSFYVSGCVMGFFDDRPFDLIHKTEKSRLTECDIEEIKEKLSPQDSHNVYIHLVYKLED